MQSLIRSLYEYVVSIWNPFFNIYNAALEAVQKKCLRRMHYKCFRIKISYDNLYRNTIYLHTLKSRRLPSETMLLYDLCYNR